MKNYVVSLGLVACITFIAGFVDKTLPNGLWYYMDLFLPF